MKYPSSPPFTLSFLIKYLVSQRNYRQSRPNLYNQKKESTERGHNYNEGPSKYSPVRKNDGYGEMPSHESPNFRESNFYDARRPQNDLYEVPEEIKELDSGLYKNKVDEVDHHQPFPHSPLKESHEINQIFKEQSSQIKSKDYSYPERRLSNEKEQNYHYNDNHASAHLNEATPPRFDYLRRNSEAERSHQQTPELENPYCQPLERQIPHEEPVQAYNEEFTARKFEEEPRNMITEEEKQYPQENEEQYCPQYEDNVNKYDPYSHPSIHKRTEPEYHYKQPEREQYQHYPIQSHQNETQNTYHHEESIIEDKFNTKMYIELFKKAVFSEISKGMTKFNPEFIQNLKTESYNFKSNVIYKEMSIKLDKHRFVSKLAEDLEKAMESKGIQLTSFSIGCNEKLNEPKLKCLFNNNQEAIEYFIKGFKTPD